MKIGILNLLISQAFNSFQLDKDKFKTIGAYKAYGQSITSISRTKESEATSIVTSYTQEQQALITFTVICLTHVTEGTPEPCGYRELSKSGNTQTDDEEK